MTLQSVNAKWQALLSEHECCRLKRMVPGEGNGDRPLLMLVGEAPGAQEAEQGRPFVGRAGKNLDGFLRALDISRGDIYITNTVKIRPTLPGQKGGEKNRPPTQAEVRLFLPWLQEEMAAVRPRAVVTLGNTPLKAVCGRDASIGEMHGLMHALASDLRVFALYHPAAVIYNQTLKAVYERDLERLAAALRALPQGQAQYGAPA